MGGEEIMTDAQRNLLFLELHKYIERVAQETAESLVGLREPATVTYPPNGGLTSDEAMSIHSHARDVESLGALRKLIADAVAAPVFHLCALLDGVSDPKDAEGEWPAFHIAETSDHERGRIMLHDAFLDSYWLWRDARPDPGWKLDTFNDPAGPET